MDKVVESIKTKKDFDSVSEAIKFISKALNLIEGASITMESACDRNGWNDEVVYQIKEAATNLGFSLATMNRWYDDVEKED